MFFNQQCSKNGVQELVKESLVNFRAFVSIFAISTFFGCATTAYKLPDMTYSEKARAQEQISNSPDRAERSVTMSEASAKLTRIYNSIASEASLTCRRQGERSIDDCNDWPIDIEDESIFNAYASGDNQITFFRQVFKVASDAEIAFILAHEIAHHSLDHINESKRNTAIGAIAGALVGAAVLGAIGDGCESSQTDCTADDDLMSDSMNIGASLGRLTYSRAQEAESDRFAITVLRNSGYQLNQARPLLLYMGNKGSGRVGSTFFDTHPSGPERVIHFDRLVSPYQP